jgi:tricorn protease
MRKPRWSPDGKWIVYTKRRPSNLHAVFVFSLDTGKATQITDGVTAFEISANGEKMLYRVGQDRWFIAGTSQPPKPGEGALRMDGMEMQVDPKAEWKQMYREAWRIERDFLYDPGAHGLDLKAAEQKYALYLEAVAHRADLTYLFQEMLGNLVLGHTYAMGGDMPQPARVTVSLLGADYKVENGRYRITRIYSGENWNPQLRAPLTQPGVNVNVGDYVIAVNGRNVSGSDSIYSFFEATANKSVVLRGRWKMPVSRRISKWSRIQKRSGRATTLSSKRQRKW